VRTAIRKHRADFIAIVGLILIAALVGGYILSKQRLTLPGWVPVVGQDFYTVNAEFSTAQSVTPGQGQTVNIAGVKIGEIKKVELVDGRARLKLQIDDKYKRRVHADAKMLLRPKTGLNDMIVELDPGTESAELVPDGGTITSNQTEPNVNLDEVLASLDGDTRDYLKLLLNGAGEGLGGQSKNLSMALRRFEPTGRAAAKITGLLSKRRRHLRRVVHNFQELSTELSRRDAQLSRFVSSSNGVFEGFAAQEASLREAIALLPGALSATRSALEKSDTLAQNLGPALRDLTPGARALGPSLRATRPFLKQTTPIIKNELRPFARATLPTLKPLRPAAADLAAQTPDLTTTFQVVNELFNTLAYNPPGDKEEGYLFWVAWANHAATSVFGLADAHGPIRRGSLLASCSTLGLLPAVAQSSPQLGTLIALLGAPLNSPACPKSSQAPTTPATARSGGK
jgi:phospholipid/cholesterol/gamma-HCH transport system substrate-binding protein